MTQKYWGGRRTTSIRLKQENRIQQMAWGALGRFINDGSNIYIEPIPTCINLFEPNVAPLNSWRLGWNWSFAWCIYSVSVLLRNKLVIPFQGFHILCFGLILIWILFIFTHESTQMGKTKGFFTLNKTEMSICMHTWSICYGRGLPVATSFHWIIVKCKLLIINSLKF